MADPEVFSLRIVSIDHYMAPPIADLDVCYSSFQGGKVNEVPVVRIYGSTPAGQKACMHMHGALPYLYVPYAEISIQPHDEADANPHAICIALEKALKLRSKAGSKRQHVHGCSLVRARKLYGYHPSEELFVKIYLYYPQDVSRAASLLLGGAVFNRTLQPHESHIPFLLQLMIDYNLYGMGLLHVSKIKFRHPVPGTFTPRKANCSGKQAQETKNQAGPSSCVHLSSSLVWVDSTIPSKWLWQCSGDIDASDQAIHLVKRQSTCELEGDSTVDEILNQQFNMYSSFSQTGSDVKMVQSLVPIWEEEYERTGVHELEISHKSGKPLPEDVLKILQHGLGFEKRLTELASEAKDSSPQFEEDGKPVKPMRTPTDGGNLSEHEVLKPSVDNGEDEYSKPFEGLQSDMIGTSAPKCTDKEALSLLKWLASSQAAEDVNSDDELSREMILSPLLPTISIDKVLEKATKDYESESQQECQDILDSVDLIDSEELKGKGLTDYRSNSLKQTIPQLDGSGDDQCSAASSDSSEKKINIKSEEPPKKQSDQDAAISISGKHQARKKLWGSLPFSGTQKVCDIVHFGSSNVIPAGNEGESSVASDKFKDTYFSDLKDSGSSFGSSVRDLMRKKRCQQSDPPYCRTSKVRKSIPEKSEADAFVGPRLLQFETPQSWREDMSASEFPNLGLPFTDQKRQISERSPLLFCAGKQVNSLKDEGVTFSERLDDEAVKETAAGSRTISGSYQLQMETRASPVIDIKNQMSLVAEATCLTNNCNEFLSTTSVESEMFNASTCRPDALVNMQSSKCTTHDKLLGHDVQQKSEAADSSKHLLEQFCRVDRWCCNNEHKCNNCFRYNPEMPSNNIGGKATTCAAVAEFERSGNPHEGGDNCRYVSGSSALRDDVVLGECTEFFGMTLFKRPPKAEFSDGSPEDAVSLPAILTLPLPKSGNDKEGTQGLGHRQHSADEFLPFFVDQDIKQAQDICDRSRNLTSNQGAQGVPTHYQNDGSLLYLLTPATSPPSRRCVSAWLSHDDIGTVRKKLDTRLVEPLIAEDRGVSSSLMGSQGCLTDASSQEIESATDNRTEHVLNQSDQLKHQDVSQISGPPGDAKPTPVSQTGFKDPASVDGCQQLTLISVEVQAESRGNLTPDPRFDAINVIAVVVQEDVDCTLDCFVLLRDDSGSHFRYLDGIPGSNATFHSEEKDLLKHFMEVIRSFDPDILMGWDVQGCSLGYLAERASNLGIGLLNAISRTPSITKTAREDSEASNKGLLGNEHSESFLDDTVLSEDVLIQDEWGRTHASGIHVGGRAVLNVWRLMRSELKLNLYTVEAVAEAVLRRKVPLINNRALTKWYSSGPGIARYRCIEYFMDRAKLNLEIINHLDLINRTSELARVFGIDFFSVLSRGSQYRVESMLLRLAHTQNYLAISPGNHQVASQPAMECLPLVMEPESGFYADPVVVLDFQSLYPSMVISYNLCFSTCLGKVLPSKENTLGVCSYSPDANVLQNLIQQILLTPNGVMYVPSKVRRGILPRLLDEILSTRIMVKHAMKKLSPSQRVLQRVFNARQLALKLIANVTYGYTAAGFSGRMPCAELADSIVQCGRRTLENAISFVNAHDKWKARVIYGDTDSMFVLLKGRTIKESFEIGQEIASAVTAMNPDPVILKLEKVYLPCFLLTKKRYTGYSYERPDQLEPIFDAKGIETVRRDTCGAVSKTMEQSLRLFFEHQDLLKVKSYLQRQWRRILSGRVSLQDFVFAKEVRLGTYSMRTSSLLPPAAIVATKAMKADPRAEPRYAERVPYVVIHGLPGARLVDMVVDPLDLLEIDSPFRLNDLYYITKQIIPALQRVFGLVKGDLNQWFSEMPRPVKAFSAARPFYAPNSHRTRIDYYYLSKHCILCGELVHASKHLCDKCSDKGIAVATAVTGRTSKLEREMQHLVAICRHCGGGDWLVESGVKCTSLGCSVFFERRKVQKELQALSSIATEGGFYPRCAIEWF